jgi:hypothetical protein
MENNINKIEIIIKSDVIDANLLDKIINSLELLITVTI